MENNLEFEDLEPVTFALKKTRKQLHKLYKGKFKEYAMLDKYGNECLTPQQGSLIEFMSTHDSVNQKELAKKLHITPATLSVRIQKLVDKGYLTRKEDEKDKRQYEIELSDLGKKFVTDIRKMFQEVTKEMFVGFTQEDLLIVQKQLEILNGNIERMINKND